MGFFDLPTSPTQNVQDFAWRYQFLEALAERAAATGYDEKHCSLRAQIIDYDHADTLPPLNPVVGEKWLIIFSTTNGEKMNDYAHTPLYAPSNDPPNPPNNWGYYGVDSAPTGDWADHPNSLARWTGIQWRFYPPQDRRLYKDATNNYYVYREGQWGFVGPNKWYSESYSQSHCIAEWTGSQWTISDLPSEDGLKLHRADGQCFVRNYEREITDEGIGHYVLVPLGSHQGLRNPLHPSYLQSVVEAIIPYFTRPTAGDYVGVSRTVVGYKRCEFWADMGVPAEARPTEDLVTINTPPTDLYNFGYLCVDGMRFAVRTLYYGGELTGDFIGHEGDIATLHKDWIWDDPPDNTDGHWEYTYTFETPADGYIINGIRLSQYGNFESDIYFKYDAATSSWVETDEVGWARTYPQTIARLDDPGEAGQRARLVVPESAVMSYVPFTRTVEVRRDSPANFKADQNGYAYGVAAPATGAWAGHEGEIAYWEWDEEWTWKFYTPPTKGEAYIFGAFAGYGWPPPWHHDHSTAKAYIAWGGDWVYFGPGV